MILLGRTKSHNHEKCLQWVHYILNHLIIKITFIILYLRTLRKHKSFQITYLPDMLSSVIFKHNHLGDLLKHTIGSYPQNF